MFLTRDNRTVAQKMLYRNGYLLDPPKPSVTAVSKTHKTPKAPAALSGQRVDPLTSDRQATAPGGSKPPIKPPGGPPVAPNAAAPGDTPPPRIPGYGMWGPDTDDSFGKIGGFEPPCRRSDIDPFTIDDGAAVMFGDNAGHGGHSPTAQATEFASKSKFRRITTAEEAVLVLNGIVDHPMHVNGTELGFDLFGSAIGEEAVVYVRQRVDGTWWIPSVVPIDMAQCWDG